MKKLKENLILDLNLIKNSMTKSNLLLAVCLCSVMLVMFFFHLECPILHATGISCPGCGMIRAYFSLLHLNIKKAFFYHPLWWLPPFVPFVWLLYRKKSISHKTYQAFFLFVIIIFFGTYFIRLLFFKSHVVRFSPEQGLFFHLFMNLLHK